MRVDRAAPFELLVRSSPDWVIIVDNATGEWIYTNKDAGAVLTELSIEPKIHEWIAARLQDQEKVTDRVLNFRTHRGAQSFLVNMIPIEWMGRATTLAVFSAAGQAPDRQSLVEDALYKDWLTGAQSRYFGMLTIERLIRDNAGFVLCFIDIDDLKSVNDEYGHAVGDRCIIKIAETLKTFSSTAVVSRIGGDEFLIVDRDVSLAYAKKRLLVLLIGLRNYRDPEASCLSFSFSYGVVGRRRDDTGSATRLLSLADKEMYLNKKRAL